MEELPKSYDPRTTEDKIYKLWEKSGFFNPDNLPDAKNRPPYTIMMPPPNVTGVLHMGHALMLTLEDIMIRYARMRGKRALWLPGTDHAAIATQSVVEKDILKKEGKNRHDLGREELLKRIEAFARQSHDTIVSQIKVMGASCDWSREAFTLDEKRSLAVRAMFKKMYDDGLIYRGNRIVNWDPKGQTTISDDEIVYEERKAKLYTFKYSKDFPISISTTRPETKIGDTAVAVHPDDKRYKQFIDKEYDLNFCGVPLHIKIVADSAADPEFGTGAVGVTPAHSMTDWEIAQRHNLPVKQVISEYARMTVGDERILDKKATEAREAIVNWLKEESLLEKEEEINQSVATAERTGGLIEPLPKLQWFIDVNKQIPGRAKSLKDLMREPVADGKIKIIPDYFGKTYFHWIENLRDWCISRHIWYGHRIPVWYKNEETYCGIEAPQGESWIQDSDTLDTWFSSGLWTFSTLGWPEKTEDLKLYHPTDVLETGYEILFFWVARMILMTGYALDDIPFRAVYLHGTVRDAKGRKMSKSLDNGIDPIEIAQKFGADAARMALVVGNTPGTDSRISEDKIKGYKHFANKLWNIARFILMNVENPQPQDRAPETITEDDKKILADMETVIKSMTKNLDALYIHEASQEIYQFAWHNFADIYIEKSKLQLQNPEQKENTQKILIYCLENILKLLHPFMPFVTEEIYSKLPLKDPKLLMIENWPNSK
ncbi:MAG: Valine-tRNA ligase [Candidatus Yanofskybacteria bacterium GW2011_GWC2_41_9]|uniref:Valine--tRNA ligase n=1 Tax=Candidatus Yanofskybacteria bacterium GW2011_GWC2_41_9 TaxID=1619029 RepID=A0A0G0XJC8_9BACT|nr:MAG: Valine-tRNA ligase [Candidatus Yanofskybacteria bacterium GW2011_GWC2_41_9]